MEIERLTRYNSYLNHFRNFDDLFDFGYGRDDNGKGLERKSKKS